MVLTDQKEDLLKQDFIRNRKNYPLVVHNTIAYKKVIQTIPVWNKSKPTFEEKFHGTAFITGVKRVLHYVLKK